MPGVYIIAGHVAKVVIKQLHKLCMTYWPQCCGGLGWSSVHTDVVIINQYGLGGYTFSAE